MNKEEREKRILDNLRLVHKVINEKIKFTKNEYEDFYMIGVEGLIKATDNYDETRQIKFSTFAYKYIYTEIISYINSKSYKNNSISLDTTYVYQNNDGSTVSLLDLTDDKKVNIEEDYFKKEEYIIINNLLTKVKISDKKRFIILLHYGFYNGRIYTRKQLAQIFNVTESYISVVIKDFIKRMDVLIAQEYGDYILDNRDKFKLYARNK